MPFWRCKSHMKTRTKIVTFTFATLLVGSIAYAATDRKKQAKLELDESDFITEEDTLSSELLAPSEGLQEKRHHQRMTIHADASIIKNALVFSGKIVNISDTGAYVATNGPYDIGERIELVIYFAHGTNKLSVTVPCTVARIDGKGIGLQ